MIGQTVVSSNTRVCCLISICAADATEMLHVRCDFIWSHTCSIVVGIADKQKWRWVRRISALLALDDSTLRDEPAQAAMWTILAGQFCGSVHPSRRSGDTSATEWMLCDGGKG